MIFNSFENSIPKVITFYTCMPALLHYKSSYIWTEYAQNSHIALHIRRNMQIKKLKTYTRSVILWFVTSDKHTQTTSTSGGWLSWAWANWSHKVSKNLAQTRLILLLSLIQY